MCAAKSMSNHNIRWDWSRTRRQTEFHISMRILLQAPLAQYPQLCHWYATGLLSAPDTHPWLCSMHYELYTIVSPSLSIYALRWVAGAFLFGTIFGWHVFADAVEQKIHHHKNHSHLSAGPGCAGWAAHEKQSNQKTMNKNEGEIILLFMYAIGLIDTFYGTSRSNHFVWTKQKAELTCTGTRTDTERISIKSTKLESAEEKIGQRHEERDTRSGGAAATTKTVWSRHRLGWW